MIMAALLDLAVAAIPIGLPTVFRRLTPESWHFGGAAYLALLVLLVPLLLPSDVDRGLGRPDQGRTAEGADAVTTYVSQRILVALDVAGVAGCSAVAIVYIAFLAAAAVPRAVLIRRGCRRLDIMYLDIKRHS